MGYMTRENLIQSLHTQSASVFLEEHLFDRVPHVFAESRSNYVTWKRELGTAIDVDPACLTLVGSAAVGCSLNPNKNLKPFDKESDIDVAIISSYHFTIAWRYLRMNGNRRYRLPEKTKNAWDEHVTKHIFFGTIATDRLLGVLPFGTDWLKAVGKMGTINPTQGRSVNLRIYADYEALRVYQSISVKKIRESLYKA